VCVCSYTCVCVSLSLCGGSCYVRLCMIMKYRELVCVCACVRIHVRVRVCVCVCVCGGSCYVRLCVSMKPDVCKLLRCSQTLSIFPRVMPTGVCELWEISTGWRRLIGSPKLQIIFQKRTAKYRSLLREMTYKDKGSYESLPPCRSVRARNQMFAMQSINVLYNILYSQIKKRRWWIWG